MCFAQLRSPRALRAQLRVAVTERAAYIARVRNLAKKCAQAYLAKRYPELVVVKK